MGLPISDRNAIFSNFSSIFPLYLSVDLSYYGDFSPSLVQSSYCDALQCSLHLCLYLAHIYNANHVRCQTKVGLGVKCYYRRN